MMPLAYGAQMSDVSYMIPDPGRKSMLIREVLQAGKVLVNATAEELWQTRKQYYKDYTGPEVTHGPLAWNNYLALMHLPRPVPPTDKVFEIMGVVDANRAGWIEHLRPGLANIFETQLLPRIEALLAQSPEISHLRRIEEFLSKVELAAGKKLHTVVLQKVKAGERSETLETFAASMEAFRLAPTIDKVPSALNTLRAVESHAPAFTGTQLKLIDSVSTGFLNTFLGLVAIPAATEVLLSDHSKLLDQFGKMSRNSEIKERTSVTSRFVFNLAGLVDDHRAMMGGSDYETTRPKLATSCDSFQRLLREASDVSSKSGKHLSGTEFLKTAQAFEIAVQHDLTKASESIAMAQDEALLQKTRKLSSIAGGAPDHKFWWEGCSDPATLMATFDKTLALVQVDQICDLASDLTNAIERHVTMRADDASKQKTMDQAFRALLKARTTQLEIVIMKTVKKSKKPVERVRSTLSSFDTELQPDGTRKRADSVLGPTVLRYLTEVLGVFAPPTGDGAEPTA